jgi:hypothetical protein
MNLNASTYAKNREKLALTQHRVKHILVFVINSYEKIISDGVKFDFNERGKIKHEDFLRNRLVDDYLEKELSFIDLGTEHFTINKEVSEEYKSLLDNEPHNDPIDIHIVDKGLKDSWGSDTKPYFAIECKRLGSIAEYVNDTKKFTERNYRMLRLPFEGQLGFIENPNWNHIIVKNKINHDLSLNKNIETTKQLETFVLKENFSRSYQSEHKKKNKTIFTVFHLFLNFSKIIFDYIP